MTNNNRGLDCRLLPHGGYTLIPATLSTMAWIASLAQDGCDYSRLTGPTVLELSGSSVVPYLEVGFNAFRSPKYDTSDARWYVDYTSHCIDYGGIINIDGHWKMAKGFAFLSLVFGGGGALFLWFSSCFVFGPGTWRWAGYEVFAASFFQGMAFLWFNTEMCARTEGNTCALFFGSKSDIVAATFWLVAAITIFWRYPEPQRKEGDARGGGGRAPDVEMAEQNVGQQQEQPQPPILFQSLELPVEGDATATLPDTITAESAKKKKNKNAVPVTEADLPVAGDSRASMDDVSLGINGKVNDGDGEEEEEGEETSAAPPAGGTMDPVTMRVPDAEIS